MRAAPPGVAWGGIHPDGATVAAGTTRLRTADRRGAVRSGPRWRRDGRSRCRPDRRSRIATLRPLSTARKRRYRHARACRRKERAVDVLLPRRAKAGDRTAAGAAPPIEAGQTLVDVFFDRVERWSDRVALRHVHEGEWASVTWSEYGPSVREVAAGLVALGIAPATASASWPATTRAGTWPTSASWRRAPSRCPPTRPGCRARWRTCSGTAAPACCFVDDRDQLAKVLLRGRRAARPRAGRRVRRRARRASTTRCVLHLRRPARRWAAGALAEQPDAVDERARGLQPDAVATLVYTSGTTGRPRAR